VRLDSPGRGVNLSVSVLIPAFRPRFLGQAIASVLAQGHEDFELIISDDSGGPDVLPVVERFRDPRIRYVTTAGRTGGGENMRGLWKLASHDLIKYLFDDDLLMPHALGDLVDAIGASPDASFAFGTRQIVDEHGRRISEAPSFSPERLVLRPRGLANSMLNIIQNPIGEFSNVLINRASGVNEADFLYYEGFGLHVVTDVGFFLNAGRRGPGIGLSRLIGAFRKHGNQNSSPAVNPLFIIGFCEWELFIRGEYSAGALTRDHALQGIAILTTAYAQWSRTLPAISLMQPGIADLPQRIEAGETAILDDEFRGRWNTFVNAVLEAKARREATVSTLQAG
jgi:hypothetical protein